MNSRQILGRIGETLAQEFYARRGYTILDRNWRCEYGELDLVCKKGRQLYIIEVKTRAAIKFGYPEEAITEQKKARLYRCAYAYAVAHPRSRWFTLRKPEIVVQVCAIEYSQGMAAISIFSV